MFITSEISKEKNINLLKKYLTKPILGIKWDRMGKKPRFRGFFEHTLDDRNRLSIPSHFRQILITLSNGEVVMTQGHDHSIEVYPLNIWEEFEDRELFPLPFNKTQVRRYRRYYTFSIKEDKIDGQGRLLIPDRLLNFAGIKKEVIITGELDHFSIWSIENFKLFQEEIQKHFLNDAEDIQNLRRQNEIDATGRE